MSGGRVKLSQNDLFVYQPLNAKNRHFHSYILNGYSSNVGILPGQKL